MAEHRTRKDKQNPNYSFLVSWQPQAKTVNRESSSLINYKTTKSSDSKKAVFMAKADLDVRIKKDILKSLVLVSLILAIEIGIYLARSKFGLF